MNLNTAVKIANKGIEVSVCEQDGISFRDLKSGQIFSQLPSIYKIKAVKKDGDSIFFDLLAEPALKAKVFLSGESSFELRLYGDGKMTKPLYYPPAWKMQESDIGIYPLGTGYAFPVVMKNIPIKKNQPICQGVGWSMALTGFQRGSGFVISGLEKPYDAEAVSEYKNGLFHTTIGWQSQKGEFAYDRTVRFFIGFSLADVMSQYRSWRESLGEIKTLKQKAKALPEVAKLKGAANFWIWDDNVTSRLYARPEKEDAPVRDVRKISSEMQKLGMTKILWQSFEGETTRDADYLKSLGFLVGKYDIYRDVLPASIAHKIIPIRVERSAERTKYWPQIVRINIDGSYAKAWKVHGLDGQMYFQHGVCDVSALWLGKKLIPEDLKKIPYNARLIDVQMGSGLVECYSKDHPMTRRECAKNIILLHDYLISLGLVRGVECGHEIYVSDYDYAEGLLSPTEFRMDDAGRRMTDVLKPDGMSENFHKYMLNPEYRIPLWELVYHDCVVNYWYWGDSGTSCPELLPQRDAFTALYGYPPIYSLDVSHWDILKEQIARSYWRTVPIAGKVGFERMTNFEYLSSDKKVQKTTFENSKSVIANLSDKVFSMPDGEVLAPWSANLKE